MQSYNGVDLGELPMLLDIAFLHEQPNYKKQDECWIQIIEETFRADHLVLIIDTGILFGAFLKTFGAGKLDGFLNVYRIYCGDWINIPTQVTLLTPYYIFFLEMKFTQNRICTRFPIASIDISFSLLGTQFWFQKDEIFTFSSSLFAPTSFLNTSPDKQPWAAHYLFTIITKMINNREQHIIYLPL